MRNRFKRLDLIDRGPDELWMEVHDIVQETGIKTIPKKKKHKKAKRLSEEALQIAEKRREANGRGEKERYTHLNAEFERTARRVKKAFLSNQCKEIEENNRKGKIRNLFKMEYYLAIKKNEIMTFAATWMDLEIIILSKISQIEEGK